MATPVCKHRANPIIIKQASPTASNTQLNSRHQYYPSAPCFEQVLAESVPDPPSLKIVGEHFQIFFVGGGAPKQGGTLPSFNFRGRQIPPHQGCWMMIGFRGCLQTGVQVPRPWYQVHSCLIAFLLASAHLPTAQVVSAAYVQWGPDWSETCPSRPILESVENPIVHHLPTQRSKHYGCMFLCYLVVG